MNYSPPQGYYDLPFTWIYDAQSLTDGNDYLNQFVYIQGGYGDFILRRIVGMDRVLNPAAGQFLVRDRINSPIQASPVFVQNVTDQMITPELLYPETGNIRFDLYDILRKTEQTQVNPIYSAQVAFQGVRRLKGVNPFDVQSEGRYRPIPYTYRLDVSLPAAQNPDGSSTGLTNAWQKINDFPFELWDVKILYAGGGTNATANLSQEGSAVLDFTAVPAGTAGNGISVTIIYPGPNNPTATISVVGDAISITVETDALGQVITTGNDVQTLIEGTPAAAALVTVAVGTGTQGAPFGTATLSGGTGGGFGSINGCNSAIWISDGNKMTISSVPMLDVFVNEIATTSAGAPYLNVGSIVPPLPYRKDSQIQLAIQSLSAIPLTASIYLIGRNRIPC